MSATDQTPSIAAPASWTSVLTASTVPPYTFHVISRAPAADRLRIKNTDGTTTAVEGRGLELAGSSEREDGKPRPGHPALGRGARFSGGVITAVRRIDRTGQELESLEGFEVPACDGEEIAGSFSAPPDGRPILDWLAELSEPAPSEDNVEVLEVLEDAPLPADVQVAHAQPASDASATGRPAASSGSRAAGMAVTVLKALFAPQIRVRHTSTEATPERKGLPKLAWAIPILLAVAALGATALSIDPAERDRQQLKWQLAQPGSIPYPADNIPSAAKNDLGRRLFADVRLSVDNTTSCATCHSPALSFTDGVAIGKGVTKRPLAAHTPSLWNMAWGHAFMWDGRMSTLEAQVRGPTSNPDEMGQSVEIGATKIAADPAYSSAFAAAFPEAPVISGANIAKAIASYQRTLISPSTRFDRWLQGDARALSKSERAGFHLFAGKAGCINCHSGWAFTDHAFHDIGLASDTPGRGRVIGRAVLDRAYKTPSLRELVWTAPYMHNGSVATLEAVVAHYEAGGVDRPTRSPDMPRKLQLSASDRGDLVAFLKSLSSDRPPHLVVDTVAGRGDGAKPVAAPVTRVGQRNKSFTPAQIRINAGETVEVVNDDSQPHNVFVTDPRMTFDSGWQEPGTQTLVPFAQAGDFELFCGIHPNMRLKVEVVPAGR